MENEKVLFITVSEGCGALVDSAHAKTNEESIAVLLVDTGGTSEAEFAVSLVGDWILKTPGGFA